MFRKNKDMEIDNFFTISPGRRELEVFYLGTSGFLIRTTNQTVLIDPGNMLRSDETKALRKINLLLFTHDHLDHFSLGRTQSIFKETAAPILAEPKVIDKLKGKIPADKLTTAESGKTYRYGDISVTAIQGIHRGSIILFQVRMDNLVFFHGGDSGYVTLKDYPSDIAFLPTGRMSPTASPENAYKMAVDLKPEKIIAMHGSEKQKQQLADRIKENMPQTAVLLVKPFTSQILTLK